MKLTILFLTLSAFSLYAQDTIRVDVNGKRVYTEIIQPTVIRDTVVIHDTLYVEKPTEPEPSSTEFELFVETNGNNSTCKPCQTLTRALQVAATMTGTIDIKIGPGLFQEPEINVPSNIGIIEGSGMDVTVITGTASMYSFVDRYEMTGFLVNFKSGSTRKVNTEIRGLTLYGNKDKGGKLKSIKGGFAIQNVNGVKIKDVSIRQFNTTGIRIHDVETITVENVEVDHASGVASSYTHYQIEFGRVGGPVMKDEFTIRFINVKLIAPTFDDGAGWGVVYGGPDHYIHNLEIANAHHNVNPGSSDSEGHHFSIEWIYTKLGNVWVHDSYFNSNLSFATTGKDEKVRFSNNIIDLPAASNLAPSLIFEMQISGIEIDHNKITNVKNGGFASSNAMETWGSKGPPERPYGDTFRQPHHDWNIHDNELYTRPTGNSHVTGFVGGLKWPVDNIRYANNRHISRTDRGAHWYALITDDTDVATGIDISGNTFEGTFPVGSQLFDLIGPISGGKALGNKSTGNFNVTKPRAGVTITP